MDNLTTEQVLARDQKLIEEAQLKAASTPTSFSPDDLEKAIQDVFDIQERSILMFIFLGDTAKYFKENKKPHDIEVIELALPKSALTYEVKSLFKTWHMRETKFGYEYEFSVPLKWDIKIPVRIYIYNQKFKLFDVPDRVWAGVDSAFIPNPFSSYWPLRHLIRAKLTKGLKLSSEKL